MCTKYQVASHAHSLFFCPGFSPPCRAVASDKESHGSPPGPAGVASLLLVKGTPLSLEAGGVQERTHIVPAPEDAYIPLQSTKVALL